MLDLIAGALAKLGTRRAFVVCSADGLDEVSLSAATSVREVKNETVRALQWAPADFGLEPCTLSQLRVDSPQASAELVREVLKGAPGPARRIVVANAAAALLVSEKVESLRAGVAVAEESIDRGNAKGVLAKLAAE